MKWLKMGWGSGFLNEREKHLQYNVSFENAVYTDRTPLEVSKRVIEEITQTYPPPYTLMCSGGVDSQTMLWFWYNSGVPFQVLSVVYKNPSDGTNFNDHDLEQLKEFSSRYQIPVHYKNFDIVNFLENDLLTYATKYECTSPQITAHMAMSEGIEGTIIFAGNFKRDMFYDYTILGLKRYADISNRNIIPYFLLYDSELAVSIDKYEPLVKNIEKKNHFMLQHERAAQEKTAVYQNKIKLLHAAQIPVISQQEKFTGFEKIKDYYDEKNKKHNLISWKEKLIYGRKTSKRVFDIMFRYKLMSKISYDDQIKYTF